MVDTRGGIGSLCTHYLLVCLTAVGRFKHNLPTNISGMLAHVLEPSLNIPWFHH